MLPAPVALAETDPALAPALEAEPSADGLLTWWLYSPVQKDPVDKAKPPLGAREGEPVADGAGKWALHIESGLPRTRGFVDFKPFLNGSAGTVWASARVHSATGGKRRLRGGTYCALRVFRDGQLVLDKPQPLQPLSDEADAEIEIPKGTCELSVAVSIRWGFCGFMLGLADGRAPAAQPRRAEGDRILVPTPAGKPVDAAGAALRSIVFISSESFLMPGQAVQVVAGVLGSTPAGLEPLSGRFVAADGKTIGAELPARTAAELTGRNIWAAQYAFPQDAAVTHEVRLEVKAGAAALGSKKCNLYSLKGLGASAQALEKEFQQRAAQAKRALPNAALAVEKFKLFLSKIETGEERVPLEMGASLLDLLAQARRCAEAEEQGRDPWDGKTGYFERAYQSRIDEQPQPYFLHVPGAWGQEGGKRGRYPLVVFLHGYVPSYDKHRWWEEMHEFNAHFEKRGAFLAIPFARSNTDFQSCGEVDVLDVIAEMKRLYPIDDDRVYLYGYSMGGMAVYHLAAHYPDTFAAGIVLAGRADSPLQNHRPLEQFAPHKQWLIHADNPISLCENFLNIPLRIYHGRNDPIISNDEARRMEKRLLELGCDAKLTLMPGDHFFGFDVMSDEAPLAWLLEQKRKAAPEKSRLKSYSLKYARQGPVTVTAATGELKPLEIEWRMKGGKVSEVGPFSAQVAQYTLNGAPSKPLDEKVLRKTPARCGPVREAICGPFMIVHGTSGSAEAKARNKANAERFAQEWFAFTRSRAIIKADSEVTDAEKKGKNLFLFGEEQENTLHAQAAAAKKLPFVVKDGQVTIGDKTIPLGANKGFMYVYPSPFAEGGNPVVVICAGIPYGAKIGVNHKLDLVPDFLLYDDTFDTDGTDTNRAHCAGFFNGEWKLDPNLTWWMGK